MFRILDRYIFREIAQSWLGVTFVLLAILLTNQFARVLGDVAKDKLPKDAIFQIIGLTAKQMAVTLPFVLLLLDWWPLERLDRSTLRRSIAELGETIEPGFEVFVAHGEGLLDQVVVIFAEGEVGGGAVLELGGELVPLAADVPQDPAHELTLDFDVAFGQQAHQRRFANRNIMFLTPMPWVVGNFAFHVHVAKHGAKI